MAENLPPSKKVRRSGRLAIGWEKFLQSNQQFRVYESSLIKLNYDTLILMDEIKQTASIAVVMGMMANVDAGTSASTALTISTALTKFKTTDVSEEEEEEQEEEEEEEEKETQMTNAIVFIFTLRKPLKLTMRLPAYQTLTKLTVIKYLKSDDRKLLDHVPHGSFVCLRSWANGTSIYCFEFNKKYACGETTSRLHHDLPPIMDIDPARPLKVIESSLSVGESFYYMRKDCDTQINEKDGNATLKFSVNSADFIRYCENDRIQSALEALKEYVRKTKPGSVSIKIGILDCPYSQFSGGGDIHICNINNPTVIVFNQDNPELSPRYEEEFISSASVEGKKADYDFNKVKLQTMANAVLCCIHNFVEKLLTRTSTFEQISKVQVLKAYAITCGINTPFFMMSIKIDLTNNNTSCVSKTGHIAPYPFGAPYLNSALQYVLEML